MSLSLHDLARVPPTNGDVIWCSLLFWPRRRFWQFCACAFHERCETAPTKSGRLRRCLSDCRNFATISSGLYRFLAIAVLLDVKDIPQVGPLQWGWINCETDGKASSKCLSRWCLCKNGPKPFSHPALQKFSPLQPPIANAGYYTESSGKSQRYVDTPSQTKRNKKETSSASS